MDFAIHFMLNNEDYSNYIEQFISAGELSHYQLTLVDVTQPIPAIKSPTLLIHDLNIELFSALDLKNRGYTKIIKLVEGTVQQDEQDPYQPIEKIIQYAIEQGQSKATPDSPKKGPAIIWITKVSQTDQCWQWIRTLYNDLVNRRKIKNSWEILKGNKSKIAWMTLVGGPEHPNGISFSDFIWQNAGQTHMHTLFETDQLMQSNQNDFIFQDANGLSRLPGFEYMDDYFQITAEQFLSAMPNFIAQFDFDYILVEGNPICDLKGLQMAKCCHLHVLYETDQCKGMGKLSSQVIRWVNTQDAQNCQMKYPPFYTLDMENHNDIDALLKALSAVHHV